MSPETQADNTPWTLGRLLNWTSDYLGRAGVEAPRLSAELLLAHAVRCKKIELYTRFDTVPDEQRRADFRELVQRAARHTPIAYLVGHKEFYSLDFEVSPDVLIPRPETELLVERSVEHCRSRQGEPIRFLDVGTGSGCVAIALLSQAPNARGVATDISAAALAVATRNRDRHGMSDRLDFVRAEGLDLPPELIPDGGFDLLVSNPPYVADDQLDALPRSVRDFEPPAALRAGADGLRFYRIFCERAPEILAPYGSIIVEIGYDQHDAVVQLFGAGGRYTHAGTWRDAGGGHHRVVQFTLEPACLPQAGQAAGRKG